MSIGSLGYDDYQRQQSWDDVSPVWEVTTAQTGAVVSEVFDCSRFGYVYAWCAVAGNPIFLQADWYVDMAATRKVGNQYITLDPNVRNVSRVTLGGFGPYVVFSMNPATSMTTYTPTVRIMLTNRPHPLPVSIVGPEITNSYSAIGAGATIENWPVHVFNGNVLCNVYGGDQGIGVTWAIESATFNFSQFYQATVAAGDYLNVTLIYPRAPVMISITNLSSTSSCNGSYVRQFPNLAAL